MIMQSKKINKTYITLLILSILIFLQGLIFAIIILISTYNNPITYSLYPKILIKLLFPILTSIFLTLISIKVANIFLKYTIVVVTIFCFLYVILGLGLYYNA